MRRLSVAALAMLLATAPALAAQAGDPLASALTAYRDLEYDAAATRLRAALAATGANRLGEPDRERAMMYLGATEVFRSRREAAIESFRTLLALNPRYRPDEILFPPEVSALFHEIRIGVRAVAAVIPAESELREPGDRLVIRLYASSLHQVQAAVRTSDGTLVAPLHAGAIGDSLELLWDARQEGGQLRTPGSYLLRITSLSPEGRSERELEVTLDLAWDVVDTLAHPVEPTYRPETAERTGRIRPVLIGTVTMLAALAIPSLLDAGDEASDLRAGVAGSLGAAGVLGAILAARPMPLPDNVAWNRTERARWDSEIARVRGENARRRSSATLRVRAARPVVLEVR